MDSWQNLLQTKGRYWAGAQNHLQQKNTFNVAQESSVYVNFDRTLTVSEVCY